MTILLLRLRPVRGKRELEADFNFLSIAAGKEFERLTEKILVRQVCNGIKMFTINICAGRIRQLRHETFGLPFLIEISWLR